VEKLCQQLVITESRLTATVGVQSCGLQLTNNLPRLYQDFFFFIVCDSADPLQVSDVELSLAVEKLYQQ
jgi:hypothetical protein